MTLGLIGASAAQAQPYYYAPRDYGPHFYGQVLPPYEIMRIVRSTGLAPLTRPMRRGPAYVVVAANRSGGQMRVVIDAMSGDIMTVNPMVAMRSYGAQPLYPYVAPPLDGQHGSYGPGPRFDGGVPPVPPRDVPHPRIATAPMVAPAPAVAPPARDLPDARIATAPTVAPPAASTAPARTPLPRPRPNVAANDAPAASSAPNAARAPVPTATAPAIIKPAPAAEPNATQMVPVAPLE
jgi:hypothetical protein